MRDIMNLIESAQDDEYDHDEDRSSREFPTITIRVKDGREVSIKSLETFDDGLHCLEVFAEMGDTLVGDGKYDMDRGEFRGIEVPKQFRRLGIATAIYDYVERLGLDVKPSPYLQPDGMKFWDNRNKRNTLSEEEMNWAASGKFWHNTKTGETFRVRGHHTLVAFTIPELAQVLKAAIGEDEFDAFAKRIRSAADSFFAGDIDNPNDPYFELHDKVCRILCEAGYLRGIHDLVLDIQLVSRYERPCRELVAMVLPHGSVAVNFDIIDLNTSVQLDRAEADMFIRGRSLKAFLGS